MHRLISCILLFLIPFNLLAEGFLTGTLVKTPAGKVPIEVLSPDDEVLTCNFQAQCAPRAILTVQETVLDESVHIKIGLETLVASPKQRFYVVRRGWVEAQDLDEDDELLGLDDRTYPIDFTFFSDEPVSVHWLTVDGEHNFFVGQHEVLTHNFVFMITIGIGAGGWFLGAGLGAAAIGTGIAIASSSGSKKPSYDPWKSYDGDNQHYSSPKPPLSPTEVVGTVLGVAAKEKARKFFAGEEPSERVRGTAEQIELWLGDGTQIKHNRAGDSIFLSKDDRRRVRFDLKNPHGDAPHMHIEHKPGKRWKDATDEHRIYPEGESENE